MFGLVSKKKYESLRKAYIELYGAYETEFFYNIHSIVMKKNAEKNMRKINCINKFLSKYEGILKTNPNARPMLSTVIEDLKKFMTTEELR